MSAVCEWAVEKLADETFRLCGQPATCRIGYMSVAPGAVPVLPHFSLACREHAALQADAYSRTKAGSGHATLIAALPA